MQFNTWSIEPGTKYFLANLFAKSLCHFVSPEKYFLDEIFEQNFYIYLNFRLLNNWISNEKSLNCNLKSAEMLLKFHGNSTEIQQKFHWNSTEIQWKFHWKFSRFTIWNSKESAPSFRCLSSEITNDFQQIYHLKSALFSDYYSLIFHLFSNAINMKFWI